MKGCINQDNKVTDLYLPRKCDYTDRIITPKDNSSIQLTISDVLIQFNINKYRLMLMELSISIKTTSSPFVDMSDHWGTLMLPLKKS
jgi:hypothetical protein